MIRSMTGFGDASDQVQDLHFGVELRSLNNRYFKAAIRLPEAIAGLEAELEALLRKRVTRGSLVLSVKFRLADTSAAHKVNDEALLNYLDHLETIQAKVGPTGQHLTIDLTALLALPGVLTPSHEDEALLQLSRPVVLRLADAACDKLNAMRAAEGKGLGKELLDLKQAILARLEIVRSRAPQVIDEYHLRLRQRVDKLLARAELEVSQVDLIKEVAIFAERADVNEELSRLSSHLDQFAQIIESPNDAANGRTLDFIAQEMLREANTIASKSNDAAISRACVEVKSAIDRIKEQVQNVE